MGGEDPVELLPHPEDLFCLDLDVACLSLGAAIRLDVRYQVVVDIRGLAPVEDAQLCLELYLLVLKELRQGYRP